MEERIGRKLGQLVRKNRSYLGGVLSKYNLTAAEQPFFVTLQHYEGITQEELTAIVCVDKAATARAVRSLEEKGYLVRLQDERDRRQNRLYPTPAAREQAARVRAELDRFNRRLTQGIDPETLEEFCQTLLKMEQNLADMTRQDAEASGTGRQDDDTERQPSSEP